MKNIVAIIRNSVNGFKSQMDAGTNSFSEQKDTAEKIYAESITES